MTIVSKSGSSRESFSTGFHPNVSHCRLDAAFTVKYDIAKLAILTGNTYKEIVQTIDFFITDRAGDNDIMLDELHIEESRRLKCNAHIILSVGASLEKVFHQERSMILFKCKFHMVFGLNCLGKTCLPFTYEGISQGKRQDL